MRAPVLKRSHQLFAEAILEGKNQQEAALAAGYSERSAKFTGYDLMKRPDIKEYIAWKQERLSERHNTTKDDIANWCWDVLELDPVEALVRDEKGIMRIDLGAAKRAVKKLSKHGAIEVTETRTGQSEGAFNTTVKITGLASLKQKALEILCRMYGFYDNSLEVKGEISLTEILQAGRNRVSSD